MHLLGWWALTPSIAKEGPGVWELSIEYVLSIDLPAMDCLEEESNVKS